MLAAMLAICPQTTSYAFEEAVRALGYLAAGDVRGAGVLRVSDRG